MLNSERDPAAGFLIEDEVFTGLCGSKFLNSRLRVIVNAALRRSERSGSPSFGLNLHRSAKMDRLHNTTRSNRPSTRITVGNWRTDSQANKPPLEPGRN